METVTDSISREELLKPCADLFRRGNLTTKLHTNKVKHADFVETPHLTEMLTLKFFAVLWPSVLLGFYAEIYQYCCAEAIKMGPKQVTDHRMPVLLRENIVF